MIQNRIAAPSNLTHAGMGRSCSVTVAAASELDPAVLADWNSLAEDAEQPNPFFAPWFLRPAIERLDPEQNVRLLLIHDDETGALTGLLPVVAGTSYARLPVKHISVWKNNHIYVGTPLIRLGYAKSAMGALIDWIGTCPMGIRFLRFTQLPADGPVYHALTATCRDRERELFVQDRHKRAVLRRDHDFDALLTESQSTKQRAELRRRIRRFDESGDVEINESDLSPDAALPLAEAFMRLENSGWKSDENDGFALAKTIAERQFFRKIISLGAAQSAISSTVLTRSGDPVAIGFTLRGQDMLFGFKTAFDRTHAKFSPGIRIFHETTRRMLSSSDISLYDSCAASDHAVLNKLWPDRQEIVQINVPAKGTRNAALVRLAAQAESAKERLSKFWSD